MRALDKIEKQGKEAVFKELRESVGLDNEHLQRFSNFLEDFLKKDSENLSLLDSMKSRVQETNNEGFEAVENLKDILKIVYDSGYKEYIEMDFSIARGLDYYTGAVFETRLNNLPGFGSVMSGGRYDELIGMFTGQKIPAVGISIGLDRLFSALVELKMTEERETVTKVLICPAGDNLACYAASAARRLRDGGINAEIYHNPSDKLGRQIGYAGKKGIPFVIILGEKEENEKMCSLKDLASGEQKYLRVEEVITSLR
ncbi:MAG: histidine--tRNA ligase family protein [Deltaproteobacteria bacterium]|nr:histidine--tRNA ligase family protein [Deltaproteobacteria bacterium]